MLMLRNFSINRKYPPQRGMETKFIPGLIFGPEACYPDLGNQ
jgi:hypothetical protein